MQPGSYGNQSDSDSQCCDHDLHGPREYSHLYVILRPQAEESRSFARAQDDDRVPSKLIVERVKSQHSGLFTRQFCKANKPMTHTRYNAKIQRAKGLLELAAAMYETSLSFQTTRAAEQVL